MNNLDYPDSLHLEAARGWCELHAFLDANEELEKIAPALRAHPQVLEVRWQIHANLGQWEDALNIATALVDMRPNRVDGWIYRASSLVELGRHPEAHELLTEAVRQFPKDEIALYDLACVCCALGRIEAACAWLGKAIEVGGEELKLRALEDPDLAPVWKRSAEA